MTCSSATHHSWLCSNKNEKELLLNREAIFPKTIQKLNYIKNFFTSSFHAKNIFRIFRQFFPSLNWLRLTVYRA